MKKLILLFVLLFTSLLWSKVPVPEFTHNAVNDYANLIDAQTEARLNQMLLSHKDSTTVEIVVLTYTDIENETIDEFANRVFNTWGVGNKKTNNGAMFILTLKPNRKYRTEVGGGLEGILTDALTKQYAERIFKPKAQSGDVSGGVLDLITAYIKETSPEYIALKKEEEKQAAIKHAQAVEAFNATLATIGIALLWILAGIVVIGGPILIIIRMKRKAEIRKETRKRTYEYILDLYKSTIGKLDTASMVGITGAAAAASKLHIFFCEFQRDNPADGKNVIDEQKFINKVNEYCGSVIGHYELYEDTKKASRKPDSWDFKLLYNRIQLAEKALKAYCSVNIFDKKDLNTNFNILANDLELKLESSKAIFKQSVDKHNLQSSNRRFGDINDEYLRLLAWVNVIIAKANEYSESKHWVENNSKKVEKYVSEHSSHTKVASKFKEIQKMQKASVVDYVGLAAAMGFLLNIIPQERRAAEEAERIARDAARRRREEEEASRRRSSSSYGGSSSGGGFSLGGGSSFGGGSSGNW